MKAQYFPHCSFLDAKRGRRASWAWSSLLMGSDLLLRRTHWQVLCGKEIRVWGDRWLPSLSGGHPMPSGPVQVSRNTKVASLINPVSDEWDIDFLKPFILSAEYEAILATHLGDPKLRDRLIWPFDKRGIYFVKLGYHWVHSRGIPQTNSRSSSSLTILVTLWKLVWQLKTPQKIRCFM